MKVYKFTVEGRYPFPLDMLRYDACYPADGDSVGNIALTREDAGGPLPNRKVVLIGRVNAPTEGRWRSFGWTVTEAEVTR